jgi:hypothetical protein
MSRRRKQQAAEREDPAVGRWVKDRLFEDEEVVMVVRPGRLASLPWYVVTLGTYGFWRKRNQSVLTSQRLIFGKGIVRRDESSIPLSRVNDVTVGRRGLFSFADLAIDDQGRRSFRRVGPIATRSARRFSREILRRT